LVDGGPGGRRPRRDGPLAPARAGRRHRGPLRVERIDDEAVDEPDGAVAATGLRVEPRLGDAARRRRHRPAPRLRAAGDRLGPQVPDFHRPGARTLLSFLSLALWARECQAGMRQERASDRDFPTSHANHLPNDGGSSMNLKPLGDRLIVKPVEEEETTASGIVLPDTAKEKPQKGKVVAVGDGAINEDGSRRPLDVSDGDEVLYSKYGGTEVTVEDEELLVLRESDVLAKVG